MESLMVTPREASEEKGRAPVLELKQLAVTFGRQQVLADVSFAVAPGALCVLLGPNGAGKTTLLRCTAGLVSPDKGRISVMSCDIGALARRELARHLAYVPQLHQPVFAYRVSDFVLMGRAPHLSLLGAPGERDRMLVDRILSRLQIAHLADKNYLQLSGGERQLVVLARGLVQQTPVILLDEPTAHLDFAFRHQIMDILAQLVRDTGLTVLVSVHDPNLALDYADQIVVIDQRVVAADLRPGEDGFLPRMETVLQGAFGDKTRLVQAAGRPLVVRDRRE